MDDLDRPFRDESERDRSEFRCENKPDWYNRWDPSACGRLWLDRSMRVHILQEEEGERGAGEGRVAQTEEGLGTC